LREWTAAELQRAVDGDPKAVREFVQAMTPVIQARVARVMVRHPSSAGRRDLRHEVADLCQQVFVRLLVDGGRALRAWDPGRGLSLPNFVGLLAEREAHSLLRSQRRSPFTEELPGADAIADRVDELPGPESQLASREFQAVLLGRLRERLSEQGGRLFEILYVDGHSIEEAMVLTGMSADALYAWRSRILKTVRAAAADLLSEGGAPPSSPTAKAQS
jgi:RNA polymerase sigma-70 factor (ECF subfamily)